MREMKRYLAKWQKLLGLLAWDIKLVVKDEADDPHLLQNDAYLLAQMPVYGAQIVLNKSSLRTWKENILHELLHLLTREHFYLLLTDEEIRNIFEKLEERMVHILTTAIRREERG